MTRLNIMPIGGVGETGALNCMLYETEDTAIIVDCGVAFASDKHPGANLIIHDFRDLEYYRPKLKALVLTHGHEDHQGSVGFFRKLFDVPIYATPFTLGIVRQKLTQQGLDHSRLMTINAGQTLSIGDLTVETVFINHSILDAVALIISGGGQRALHLTDFKIDHAAPEGQVLDLARIKKLGEEGLDVLLMDSTNVFSRGWTTSESTVRTNLLEYFTKIKGRIVACLFSSNMFRIQSLVECARITGRRIAFTGRSTKEYIRIAREIGRLNLDGVSLHDVEEVAKYPDSEILVLVTGSQAEPRSVLQRMSQNMFKPFKLRSDDTLLMSSKMIPGNEGEILEMLNRVALLGPTIITEELEPPIHASGHAKQDELREIFRIAKPRFFIPIHGEYRHLQKHVEIAHKEGLTSERCLLILNGDKVAVTERGAERVGGHVVGRLLLNEVDLEMQPEVVSRRRKIGQNGLIGVSVVYDQLRELPISDVILDTTAMLGGDIDAECVRDLTERLHDVLSDGKRMDTDKLMQLIKVEVRQYYKHKHQIRPEVMVMVNEI